MGRPSTLFLGATATAAIAILLLSLFSIAFAQQKVRLRDVTSLTLRRGEYTTGRRSSPVPQLSCTGGTAYGQHSPTVVQCYNRGFDGVDVQWECTSQLPSDYQFGKITVSCEGYDYPEDPYILAGSCGLNYELDYTAGGLHRQAYAPTKGPGSGGISFLNVIYFGIAAFVVYLIYTTLTAPRQGNEGDRRRGGGGGGGYDDGGGPGGHGPPPPGWNPPPPPSYDDTFGTGGGAGANKWSGNTASAPPPPHAPPPPASSSSTGPGFFTGLGLGGLGGYLFGRSGNGNRGGAYRRRGHYNTNDNYWGGGGDEYYDQPGPSTSSSSYRSGGGGGGTHTSSGYGGTSRR